METVINRVFLFTTSSKFENLQLKLRKENLKVLSFFAKETTQKTDSNMDEEEYRLQSKLLLKINKQKSENTKERRLLI